MLRRNWMLAGVALFAAGCGGGGAQPAPGPPTVEATAEYAVLPDTLVCVVDRTADRGLRELEAKVRDGDAVVLSDGRIRPLSQLHPISLIAGYAGSESWYQRGSPISLQGRQYQKYGGERRVPLESVTRIGEYQGLPLYASPDDPSPPPAVYVPVRPGCIFHAYVREDLFGA